MSETITTARSQAHDMPPALTSLAPVKTRLVSLDAFRGATILGMIIVNNPGTWSAVHPPLRHAAWHGWTPTDLVFPFFLFIVGVAIVLAYTKRLAGGAHKPDLVKKAARRTVILFGLGLLMAAWPIFTLVNGFGFRPEMATLRIMGVLQRIAICYWVASLLVLYVRPRTEYYILGGLLLGYWVLMTLVPVPDYGAGRLDVPEGTLSAWLDRLILGTHLWTGTGGTWDPEGLLSTIPAIGTTLLGVWTGRLLLDAGKSHIEKVATLLVRGAVLITVGYVWHWFFPINKGIWTSSYVVFTGGQAMSALGLCYWAIDIKGYKRWAQPFVVYGVNALTVFVMSGILARTLGVIQVGMSDGSTISLQTWIFGTIFLPLASPINASLLYAIAWVVMWYLILLVMYKKHIIIKV